MRRYDVGSVAVLSFAALLIAVPFVAASASTPPPAAKSAPSPDNDPQVRDFIEASKKAYDKGQLLLAIIQARNAVRIAPLSAAARAQLGICLMQGGDAYNAEDQLRRARFLGASDLFVLPHLFEAMLARGEYEQLLEEFPDPGTPPAGQNAADVLKARAVALQAIGQSTEANASINRSLAIRHDAKGLVAKANMALDQGDPKLAKSATDEALSLNQNDAESLNARVRVALAMHDNALALATADKLVTIYPASLTSRLTRISVYLATDMDEKAKADVDLVNKQYPSLTYVVYYRALLLARANDPKAAWKLAIALPSEFLQSDPQIGNHVAAIAIQSGHPDPASAILHATVDRWPHDQEARIALATLRLQQNNPQDALNVLFPLQNSQDSRVAMLFGRAFTALHRPDEAKKYLDIIKANGGVKVSETVSMKGASLILADWLRSNPGDLHARQQYALVLLRLGDRNDAIAQYELILKAAPNTVSALNDLGWLIKEKDPRRAYALASRAAKLSPNSPTVLDTEGWIAYLTNEKPLALDALGRAHALKPDSATISYHLAQTLDSLGRLAEAKAILKPALESNGADFEGRADAERLLASLH